MTRIIAVAKALPLILATSFICPLQGQEIEDFALDNLHNEQVYLDDIRGDALTIIDFWATWCKPCTKAMPKLNELYNKYKDQGVSMIGISCDGPRSISTVPAVASSLNIDYHILKDIDCEVMNTYQYQVFPTLIMLNKDKEVIYVHEGFNNGDEKEIQKVIEEHLK